jgi:hypothetical protein
MSLKRKTPDSSDSDVPIITVSNSKDEDDKHYLIPVNLKHAATVKWRDSLILAEVIHMKGNFWNKCGFSRNSLNYLYPEEALMLVERGQIFIEGIDGEPVLFQIFYEMVISHISLPVHLAYLKLKVYHSVFVLFLLFLCTITSLTLII